MHTCIYRVNTRPSSLFGVAHLLQQEWGHQVPTPAVKRYDHEFTIKIIAVSALQKGARSVFGRFQTTGEYKPPHLMGAMIPRCNDCVARHMHQLGASARSQRPSALPKRLKRKYPSRRLSRCDYRAAGARMWPKTARRPPREPVHRTTADKTNKRFARSPASDRIRTRGIAPTLQPPYQISKAVTP